MIRLGILGSTRGTHLIALMDAILKQQLPATINVVLCNKADAMILERATNFGIPAIFVDAKNISREIYDEKISQQLKAHAVDLVVLIGYMRILSPPFVEAWENKIINVHPSLLPAFAGKMDLDVHQAVIDAGVPETGCTVHYVTKEVDAGPIILQRKCKVFKNDTAELLKARVQALEADALIAAIMNAALLNVNGN